MKDDVRLPGRMRPQAFGILGSTMHIDLDHFDGQALPRRRFCIVGAGIAGLVLSQRLASKGFEINLLEAGGLELEERSQDLYRAKMSAAEHTGTTLGRFRTFGGSSTRWGGQLLPYTADLFKPGDGSDAPEWPIEEAEIAGYYESVQRIFHAGTLPFTEDLLKALGKGPSPFSNDLRLRFSKWAPFARRNLAQTIGRECLTNPRIHLFTHANVAELCASEGRITHARLLDYRGRSFEVAAEEFIVAAGTIESSRILLSSPTIPNCGEQFGQGFHDHVSMPAAVLPPPARKQIMDRLGPFFVNGVLHTVKIEAAPDLRKEHGLLAVMAHFVVEEPEDSGIAAVRNLLTSIQRRNFTQALTANLVPMIRGTGDVARLAWASKVLKRRAVSNRAVVRLTIDLEQPAKAGNRIRLSGERDAIGLPRAIVDWRIGEAEQQTASRFARLMKLKLAEAGFSPLEWLPGVLEGEGLSLLDTYHAMGGLRMGTEAATSVVDRNLNMHVIGNLHIASCAVFPSGGSSNPTFTLIAITMRLADRLGRTR